MTKAVENILRFSTALRQDWALWSGIFCHPDCSYIDACWTLQIACVSHPGKMAEHLRELETLTPKTSLLEKPTNAKALKDFVVAECLAGHGVRAAAKAVVVAPSGPIEDLNFNGTDEKLAEAESDFTAKIAELSLVVIRLRQHNTRKRNVNNTKDEQLNKFKAKCDSTVVLRSALPRHKAESVRGFEDLREIGKDTRQRIRDFVA